MKRPSGRRLGRAGAAVGGLVAGALALSPLAEGAGAPARGGATSRQGDVGARLVGGALAGGRAYALVQSLTDTVGPRPSGSAAAERAVAWALDAMRAAGLQNVHREPVEVPHWERGGAAAELLGDHDGPAMSLALVALGPSVATPPVGITAEVVEVSSLEELARVGERARGRIVLFNKPMVRSRGFDGYGAVVGLRSRGAVEAARLGAVASLVRSVGTASYRLPHTGGVRYDAEVPRIPAAALAAEDADLLHRRLATTGSARVHLVLSPRLLADVESANVVGEIPGRERGGEVVLVGAHLDSWDLGAGAIDDGAGCAIVLETARLVAGLAAPPRRTLRVVLYMNEESGLSGALAYAAAHSGELARHVGAMEADAGAGRPLGYSVVAAPGDRARAIALVTRLATPVSALGVGDVTSGDEAGADLLPLQKRGVPVLAMRQDGSSYFDWHHTAADTLDKIEPLDLALDVAAFATMAYGLADAAEKLPPSPPPSR